MKKKIIREKVEAYGVEKALRDALAGAAPSDLDGHTDFRRLTPEQRLEWLSQVVQFTWMVKRSRRRR